METAMVIPQIVLYGQKFLEKYAISEYMNALKRAFSENQDGFIILDSNPRGQEFLSACTAWALEQKIIWHATSIDDGQSVISSFRLTDFGKEFLNDWS